MSPVFSPWHHNSGAEKWTWTCPDLRTGQQTSRGSWAWQICQNARRDHALICPEPRETERTAKYVDVHVARDSRQPWGQSRWREAFSAAPARLCLECKHVRKVWESLCVHAGDRFLCFGSQGNNSWWWARLTLAGFCGRAGGYKWGFRRAAWKRQTVKNWVGPPAREGDTGAVFFKVKLCWWTNGFSINIYQN